MRGAPEEVRDARDTDRKAAEADRQHADPERSASRQGEQQRQSEWKRDEDAGRVMGEAEPHEQARERRDSRDRSLRIRRRERLHGPAGEERDSRDPRHVPAVDLGHRGLQRPDGIQAECDRREERQRRRAASAHPRAAKQARGERVQQPDRDRAPQPAERVRRERPGSSQGMGEEHETVPRDRVERVARRVRRAERREHQGELAAVLVARGRRRHREVREPGQSADCERSAARPRGDAGGGGGIHFLRGVMSRSGGGKSGTFQRM